MREGGIADYLEPKLDEIAGYLESLHKRGLSPSSRQLAIVALKSFYERLASLDRMSVDAARPVLSLANLEIPERLPDVLTVEQVIRLLDAPPKTCRMYWLHKAMLEYLFASACRCSEVVNLLVADIDLDAGTARVRGKGSKERVVLFGEQAVQSLNAYIHLLRPDLTRRKKEELPWFFVSRAGRQLDREYVWLMVHRYAVQAGLPEWVGAHSLRHAALTAIIKGGCDLRFVQALAGHSRAASTAIYLHLSTADLRRAHDKFEAYRSQGDDAQGSKEEELYRPSDLPPEVLPINTKNGRANYWSAAEDELVESLTPEEAAARTGRSLRNVRQRRKTLQRIKRQKTPDMPPPKYRRWTPEEDEMLRTLSIEEAVARLHHRSICSIRSRRKALGIRKFRSIPWTPSEDEMARTMPVDEVARITGRTTKACRTRRNLLLRQDREQVATANRSDT